MIQGFFQTVNSDVQTVYNYCTNKNAKFDEKVQIAALRVLTASAITLAAVAVVTSKLVGAVVCAGLYVLLRDVYIMERNYSKDDVQKGLSAGKGKINDVADGVKNAFKSVVGEETQERAPRQYITEGTLLRPMWDTVVGAIKKTV